MRLWFSSALKKRSHFVVGLIVGAVLFSGSAYAVTTHIPSNSASSSTNPLAANGGGKVYWGVAPISTVINVSKEINTGSQMVRKIMYTLRADDLPAGYYQLRGAVSGEWAETAIRGSLLRCFFQSESEYSHDGAFKWGSAVIERQSWSSVVLNAFGDWSTDQDPVMYFVCKASDSLKGLTVEVEATSAVVAGKLP